MVLQVKNLSKIYLGKINYTALERIEFNLKKGEFVGVMGPSGSGKTTLLNCVSTIDEPSTGEVLVNGKNPHKLGEEELSKFRRSELGFVFQDFNLVNTLTVKENIILPLVLDNIGLEIIEERLNKISKLLGIKEILNKRTFEISGGQAQRIAIARALIHNPSLLLADEPTGNLDTKAAKDVMKIFTAINEELNTSILMVTHDPYIASFCNRVIFIKDGNLYNEIHKGDNKSIFYKKIIDMLSFLGGNIDDI
ncbi:ABC transporter ATP-binding protein [Tissierella pigra]|uniref:ABC transporter ATP-binding protein n=1 Tax=Tissierella pigra TaxID=2607614 RepID=A0A6N7XI20_9FIRM|nr:ABC transporter ATP-binding protein [Tissierella pigra]MBU5426831.1 ABC transporter ATP-binding protein [Tissierella pigra]MSU01296.1 ABC transporter ATP-binding protein [Tissierella pigra]